MARITTNRNGGNNREFLKYADALLAAGFKHEQIVALAAHNRRGMRILEKLVARLPELKQRFATIDQIFAIADRHNGVQAIDDALDGIDAGWIVENGETYAETASSQHADDSSAMTGVQVSHAAPTMKRQASNQLVGDTSKHRRTEVEVKLERDTLTADMPTESFTIQRLNTSQELYIPTTSYTQIDLSDDGGPKVGTLTVRDADNAITVNSKQVYDPELEKIFPIRDPAHPNRVHPLFADPADPTRCAESVQIEDIQFYKSSKKELDENQLWQMAQNNFETRTPYRTKDLFLKALKRSCMEELNATLRKTTPPSCKHAEVIKVEARHCDSEDEARAMGHKKQYGVVPKDYAEAAQPSLRNAKIVCFFGGSMLESDEDDQAYLDTFGPELGERMFRDYAANARQYGAKGKQKDGTQVTFAPCGGGNMGQYLNARFGNSGASVLGNARFVLVILYTIDANGQKRRVIVLGIMQTAPVEEGKQFKLFYGRKYTLDAEETNAMEVDNSEEPTFMKIEAETP